MTTLFDKPVSGFRYIELQWGDTLQQVAARELGDAARWIDIANLNGLVYPYIAEQSGENVAAYGDAIMVPSPVPMASSSSDPDLVFERDVALSDGRLTANNSDFLLVSGLDNLKQALTNRIDVDQGELLFHQDYGSKIRRLIGTVNGPTAGLLGARYAKAAVLADPRVSKVNRANAEVVGDRTDVDVEVQPISGRSVQISTGVNG